VKKEAEEQSDAKMLTEVHNYSPIIWFPCSFQRWWGRLRNMRSTSPNRPGRSQAS